MIARVVAFLLKHSCVAPPRMSFQFDSSSAPSPVNYDITLISGGQQLLFSAPFDAFFDTSCTV
jgi:hypothetical protein